ncbi:MAG: hypothetical protein AB7N54_02915 [Alphaproteobacteria bacterium]
MLVAALAAIQPAAPARAQDFGHLRQFVRQDVSPLVADARAVGEACVFGAAAGAFGMLVFGAPLAASGVGAPSIASITLGAAAAGCVLGFVGSSAATAFGYLWERSVAPSVENSPGRAPRARPGETAPEMQAGPAGSDRPAATAVSYPVARPQ